ncbi:MAG: hypothetical protein JWL83_1515 [Actinomycetia bacterium]|nr:hypothetical protein [Actinomycetes bacterium]
MELLEALPIARAEFERRLRAVTADQWDAPTPCAGWSVRDLANHIVAGNRMSVMRLHGADREDVLAAITGGNLGDDPIGAFTATADAQEVAFGEPGAFDRVCHTMAGEMPGAQLLAFRIGDYTLHAWDLARGLGGDESLPEPVVALIWENLQPLAPRIGQIGVFGSGPSGNVAGDAPLQDRLLDLTGRRA